MNERCCTSRRALALGLNDIQSVFVAVMFLAALYAGTALAEGAETNVSLTGGQEVPAVETSASGTGTIVIAEDKTVSGSVTTTRIEGIAAHIHLAPPGENGPPVVPLEKKSEHVWAVPAGARLTDEQYASYLAGNLYVNVHSAAHKPGEIRGQLEPPTAK